MEIRPSQYRVALTFLEEDSSDYDTEVLLATINGVGAEVKGYKKGDTVLVMRSSKDEGIKVDDVTYVVSDWCLVGLVTDA